MKWVAGGQSRARGPRLIAAERKRKVRMALAWTRNTSRSGPRKSARPPKNHAATMAASTASNVHLDVKVRSEEESQDGARLDEEHVEVGAPEERAAAEEPRGHDGGQHSVERPLGREGQI